MSDKGNERYWVGNKDTYRNIRLVRAPLTFGHSQFRFKPEKSTTSTNDAKPNDSKESGKTNFPKPLFEPAGGEIDKAIKAMHKCLEPELFAEFPTLKTVTDTEGKLLKVLVLRASATEDVDDELKIHLVPYFDSHHKACQKRFERRHQVLPGELGGMLGWLGEVEDTVDKWEVDHPREDRLNNWADKTLRLTELAEKLHDAWDALANSASTG